MDAYECQRYQDQQTYSFVLESLEDANAENDDKIQQQYGKHHISHDRNENTQQQSYYHEYDKRGRGELPV